MDSPSPLPAAPSILVVEDMHSRACPPSRPATRLSGSGEEALDLIAAAEFDGLYCAIELPGGDGWEVGTTFSFIWPGPSGGLCLREDLPRRSRRPENLTAARIKPASSFVHLS